MADLVKIVDSIAASPTVRLDLNGEATNGWYTRMFKAPPPRLRRAVAANAMRDGVHVSSSSYDARMITLELELHKTGVSAQDDHATELQKLARELDRPDNFLMYQPNGLTKPVFFKVFRSDFTDLEDVIAQAAMRRFTVELLAEPFALGLRETLGPYTVNNDPAAGSNGCFVDLVGVLGDVPVPLVIQNTSAWRTGGIIASRISGTPSDLVHHIQCESAAGEITLGTDTTVPGGGPDAALSGSGSNNYASTSFTTASAMTTRVTWALVNSVNTTAKRVAFRGRFRVMAVVRQSSANPTIQLRARVDFGSGVTVTGSTVTIPVGTARKLVDLGVFDMSGDAPGALPYTGTQGVRTPPSLELQAGRTAGSDSLHWDGVFLFPADDQTLYWASAEAQDTSLDAIYDGYQERLYPLNGSDPFASGSTIGGRTLAVSGGFPVAVPGQTNRFFVVLGTASLSGSSPVINAPVGDTNDLTFHYFPRYLYVRPSAS